MGWYIAADDLEIRDSYMNEDNEIRVANSNVNYGKFFKNLKDATDYAYNNCSDNLSLETMLQLTKLYKEHCDGAN